MFKPTKARLKIAAIISVNIVLALFLIVFRLEFQAMAASTINPVEAFIGRAALFSTWLFVAWLALQAVVAAVLAWKSEAN